MTFYESIQTVLRKYAEFSGRAGRAEYWWWVLFYVLVAGVINVLNAFAVNGDTTLGTLLFSIWWIVTLLPSLAVTIRRLRDAGYGWGHIFWSLLPFVGVIILIVFLAQPSVKPARKKK